MNFDVSTRSVKIGKNFEQKIGIKPHLQPLDLQGELTI